MSVIQNRKRETDKRNGQREICIKRYKEHTTVSRVFTEHYDRSKVSIFSTKTENNQCGNIQMQCCPITFCGYGDSLSSALVQNALVT